MSELQVEVQRRRPVCPYCHDEVVSGDVWICVQCEGAHHAECRTELGGCGACDAGRSTPPRPEVRSETKGEPAAEAVHEVSLGTGEIPAHAVGELPLDPRLELRATELQALGFQLVTAQSDTFRALHPTWRYDWLPAGQPLLVEARRVGTLTRELLVNDRTRLAQKGARVRISYYLADEIASDARSYMVHEANAGFFPVAQLAETSEGSYSRRSALWGFAIFPGLRYLARRLLFPQVDRKTTREPRWHGVGLILLTGSLFALGIWAALHIL